MNRWIRYLACAIAISGLGSTAEAEDIKVYTGIAAGSFSTDYGTSATGSVKGKTVLGSYLTVSADINPYLSYEVRFGKTGKSNLKLNGATWAGHSSSVDSFGSMLIRPQFPFDNHGHVYAIIGVSTINLSYRTAGLSYVTKNSGISFGGGFKVHIADTWAIGSEFTQYSSKQDLAQRKARVSGITATVNYLFD